MGKTYKVRFRDEGYTWEYEKEVIAENLRDAIRNSVYVMRSKSDVLCGVWEVINR